MTKKEQYRLEKIKRNLKMFAEWQTEKLSYSETGRRYGISRERARKLILRIKEKTNNV